MLLLLTVLNSKKDRGWAALKSIIFTVSLDEDISGRSAKGNLGTVLMVSNALMLGVEQCNNLRTKYVPYVILNTTRLFGPPTHSAA
jgi:hypothetical protein